MGRRKELRKRKERKNTLISSLHLRTSLRAAKLGDSAVQQIDLIVKVDNVDSKPLIRVFTLGQAHDLSQTATTQCRLGKLLELPTIRALNCASRLEGSAGAATVVVCIAAWGGEEVSGICVL
jgi:hypothetical protein